MVTDIIVVTEIVVGAVLCTATGAGVWLANKIHARDNEPDPPPPLPPDPKREERRILERQRQEWLNVRDDLDEEEEEEERAKIDEKLDAIDEKLIELAKR